MEIIGCKISTLSFEYKKFLFEPMETCRIIKVIKKNDDNDACAKVTLLVRNGGGPMVKEKMERGVRWERGIYNDSLTNKTNTKWLGTPLSSHLA